MLHRLKLLCFTLFIVLLSGIFVNAQSDDIPRIISRYTGDGYAQLLAIYDDGHEQALTTQPYVLSDRMDVAISPSNRYLVYRVVADFFAEGIANNEVGNFNFHIADLYLLDLQTGENRLIAGQEEGAALRASNLNRNHPVAGGHSAIWSPDSSQLVYAIQRPECFPNASFCSKIMIYDVESDTSRAIVDEQFIATPRLWTSSGIVIHNQPGSFSIYTPEGSESNRVYYNSDFAPRYLIEYEQGIYAVGNVLGFPNPDKDVWYLLNLETGTYFKADALISVISASTPDTSLILVDYSNDTRPATIYSATQEFVARPPSGPPFATNYILSPDGTEYSYDLVGANGGDAVIGDLNDETVVVRDGQIVAWGARQYTLFNRNGVSLSPSNDPYTINACGALPAVGLIPGNQGQVLPGSPNRLRSTPYLDAEVIGNIPGGETFLVADGQQNVCIDGIRWAQVTYSGNTGWTAEGFDGASFVESVP